jgi:hypothetical protein
MQVDRSGEYACSDFVLFPLALTLAQSESAAAALALKTAVTGSRRKSLPLPGVTAIVAAPKVLHC